MATLNGKQINNTYSGLLKTNDEAALGATEKAIQDGEGNNSTLSMGTGSASFTGTLDLSGATVTGLPADVNTTYDLASAQNSADVDVTLTGSDATTDTVKLVAGSNITLTDDGSNNITIQAAADNDTTYDLASAQNGSDVDVTLTGSDATTDTIKLVAGSNVTLADDGSNNITVTSTDTNATYTYTLSQNGANVDLELAGSGGGANSEVQAQAGTNITLTQNGPTSL